VWALFIAVVLFIGVSPDGNVCNLIFRCEKSDGTKKSPL